MILQMFLRSNCMMYLMVEDASLLGCGGVLLFGMIKKKEGVIDPKDGKFMRLLSYFFSLK